MIEIIASLYSLTNATPSERAMVLLRMLPKDTQDSIDTFEALKRLFHDKLEQKEKHYSSELKTINQYMPQEMKIVHHLHTDLPLNEIEVDYEQVKNR